MQTTDKLSKLGVILPCYNEEEILNDSFKKLHELLSTMIEDKQICSSSFIVFVDDGSRDKTWELINSLASDYVSVKGLKLSRNFGHQSAILAGMLSFNSECDCLVTIDADLQDDIDVMPLMIKDFLKGSDIVYGVRKERPKDSFFKKSTALGFYRLMKWLGVNIVYNHADYRLVSKRVVDELKGYNEVNLFLRGIFPLIGFKSTQVFYNRKERLAGETKFPFKKMFSFAMDGVTSFSVRPLRIITVLGMFFFIVSLILCGYAIFSYLYLDSVPGWASIVLPIYFIGGVQLLSIGIIGEYLGKIYKEVKQRPLYIIEKIVSK
jgi:glycosyltransferase involved in cell wall biosynthesis